MIRTKSVCRPFLILIAACLAVLPSPAFSADTLVACGGSRASQSTYYFPALHCVIHATLQGSTVAEIAINGPKSLGAHWIAGRMFGFVGPLGRVEVSVAENPPSLAEIVSKDPTGANFFPAIATQELYWVFEAVNAEGQVTRRLVNREPMRIQAEIQQIPPYETKFPILGDVAFYDEHDTTGVPVFIIRGGVSFGILHDIGGLKISLVDQVLDPQKRTFQTRWKIQNLTSKALRVHWFATGIHGATIDGSSGARNVLLRASSHAASSVIVSLAGTFDPDDPTSGLALNAMSAPGLFKAEDDTLYYFQP
jgi:hypothetical protein